MGLRTPKIAPYLLEGKYASPAISVPLNRELRPALLGVVLEVGDLSWKTLGRAG